MNRENGEKDFDILTSSVDDSMTISMTVEKKDRERLTQITGIKGISSLFIVIFHYFCVFYGADTNKVFYPDIIKNLFQYSQYCVELFFMISGFLMAYNYKDRIKTFSFIQYTKKKVGSIIFPLAIANIWALINNIAMQNFVNNVTSISINLWNLLISIIPVHNGWVDSQAQIGLPVNGTMWFIDVLVLCYIIYYIIGRFTKNEDQYIIGCLIMVCVGYACLTCDWEIPFLYYVSGRGYAPFFFGSLLYEITSRIGETNGRHITICLMSICGVGFIIRIFTGLGNAYGDFYKYFIYFLCPTIIMTAIYIKPIRKLLSLKVVVYIGTISMGVYFVHDALFRSINLINIVGGSPINFQDIVWLPVFITIAIIGGVIWSRVPNAFREIKISILEHS